MREIELLYLRDLAIKHLPESERLKVIARTEEIRGVGPLHVTSSLKGYSDIGMAVSAVETTASLLFDAIVDYPLKLNELDFGDIKGYENYIRESGQKLADVAGFALPVWLTENHNPEALTLQQEVDSLRVEIERLKAENKGLRKADDPRQIRNMAKAIYGIAVEKYRYDPSLQRNAATGAMSTAAEKKGVKITQGTIKRYIDQGKQYLDEDGE